MVSANTACCTERAQILGLEAVTHKRWMNVQKDHTKQVGISQVPCCANKGLTVLRCQHFLQGHADRAQLLLIAGLCAEQPAWKTRVQRVCNLSSIYTSCRSHHAAVLLLCMLYKLLTVDSLKHCSQGMLGSKTLSMVLGYRRR